MHTNRRGGRQNPYAGLQLLSTGVILTDSRGRVAFVNQAAEQMLGSSARLLVGEPVTRYLPAVSAVLQSFGKAGEAAVAVRGAASSLVLPFKEPLPVTVSAGASEELPDTLVIEFQEMTDSVRLSADEERARGTESVRQLVRNLAHEVKNPLGGIRGAAQLLAQDLASSDQRECTDIIIEEADRLQNLVDRLLAPFRSALKPESVNVHEVLEHVRLLVAAEFGPGLSFVRDYDPSVPDLACDRQRITQVFVNLIRNAAEAVRDTIGSGACIRIRTRICHQAHVGVNHYRYALQVQVCDNGPGVPESIRERIFVPLISGRAGGSGIGLSLTQTYVQQHDGSIRVDSEPGNTVFTVCLPYRDTKF